MRRFLPLLAALAGLAGPLAGQDTTRTPDRIILGTEYRPGARPGIVILPATRGLDSLRTILARDLDYSDRFEVITLRSDSTTVAPAADSINYALYQTLGAILVLELRETASGVNVRLHDVERREVRVEVTRPLDVTGAGESRLGLHRLADEIVQWGAGVAGYAASRILFVSGGRIFRIDSDGYGLTPMTPGGQTALSPAWSPDGSQFAYVHLHESGWSVVLQRLATGSRATLPTTDSQTNITPVFSPDGRFVVFAQSGERGTNLVRVNVGEMCCVERLTSGPFADNLSPAYSPDGRRIGFVSTRAGGQQIYAMASDGTQQELLVPFDFGRTGSSNAPEWSPDGTTVAFHRETARTPQIWVFDIARRQARQLSSSGRNEDPSWAPDGRHLVFVSDRTGRGQLHVIDLDTFRVRQIPTPGVARLPAWSRHLSPR